MTQKLVEIPEGMGEEPRLKMTQEAIDWCLQRPAPAYNAYICRRRQAHLIVTVDIHPGVTPMFLGCKNPHCESEMISAGYPDNGAGPVPPHLRNKPVWLWYRPNEDEFRKMPPEMRDHIMRGGLALRDGDRTYAEWEADNAG